MLPFSCFIIFLLKIFYFSGLPFQALDSLKSCVTPRMLHDMMPFLKQKGGFISSVTRMYFRMLVYIFSFIYNVAVTHIRQVRGSFFMFVESGCISTNIDFTVP